MELGAPEGARYLRRLRRECLTALCFVFWELRYSRVLQGSEPPSLEPFLRKSQFVTLSVVVVVTGFRTVPGVVTVTMRRPDALGGGVQAKAGPDDCVAWVLMR